MTGDLVVDSSVAIKWFIDEPYSLEARRVLAGFEKGSVSFLAPDLINAEFGNILWKKHKLQGLEDSDAQRILSQFRQLQFRFTSSDDLLDDAFLIAARYDRTVYDALYLALGVRTGCQVVTADERLVNAVRKFFPNVVWLADWP